MPCQSLLPSRHWIPIGLPSWYIQQYYWAGSMYTMWGRIFLQWKHHHLRRFPLSSWVLLPEWNWVREVVNIIRIDVSRWEFESVFKCLRVYVNFNWFTDIMINTHAPRDTTGMRHKVWVWMIVIRVPEASIVNTRAYLNQPDTVMKVKLTV